LLLKLANRPEKVAPKPAAPGAIFCIVGR
jgi:hypothetical protein